jgi:hypothetical protein
MRRIGIAVIVVAYALLLYTSLAAPAYARAHANLGSAMLAEYAGPWPVALGCALATAGIVLAVIPIRRGEMWAIVLSAAMLLMLLVTRLVTDPRCAVVLDPHQHGCHTFMISIVLGMVGLVLVGGRRFAFHGKR